MEKKRNDIAFILINMFVLINMDKPENFEQILDFCLEDINETADPENWSNGDVTIAFRRFIEKDSASKDDYFSIVHKGYQSNLQREEIQVHAGENGNIFLIKTDEGFAIDVYGQNDIVDTMAVWEEDLNDGDLGDEPTAVETEDFVDMYGKYADELASEFDCTEKELPIVLRDSHFFVPNEAKWIPFENSAYDERDKQIGKYIHKLTTHTNG